LKHSGFSLSGKDPRIYGISLKFPPTILDPSGSIFSNATVFSKGTVGSWKMKAAAGVAALPVVKKFYFHPAHGCRVRTRQVFVLRLDSNVCSVVVRDLDHLYIRSNRKEKRIKTATTVIP
jgi:hypothetical protein